MTGLFDFGEIWKNFKDARGWDFPDPNEFLAHKIAQWTDFDGTYQPPEKWRDGKGLFGTISEWLDKAIGWVAGFLPNREMPLLTKAADILQPSTINFTDAQSTDLAKKLEENMLAAAKEATPKAYSGADKLWKPGNEC